MDLAIEEENEEGDGEACRLIEGFFFGVECMYESELSISYQSPGKS